jgi:hypothetical protein
VGALGAEAGAMARAAAVGAVGAGAAADLADVTLGETPAVAPPLAATPVPVGPADALAGGLTARLPDTVAGGDTAAVWGAPPEAVIAPPVAVEFTELSGAGADVADGASGVGLSRREQPAASNTQASRPTADIRAGMAA